ncbi:MAG TPA: hypothetical protein P5089_01310 [Candidatus Portnoybacteria bacterium]|nr:hypothetical protein [Candidatus Portnoybacteria bacterium]
MAKDELLVKARALLQGPWDKHKKAGLVGRCWGKCYNGSTIVLANEKEAVVISLDNNQQLQIKEFSAVMGGTKLGNEINRLLAPLKK